MNSSGNQQHGMRIGDAEREAAVSDLGEHYAAGRLTKDEYDERADRAWSARTGSDLHPLFADLPGTSPSAPPGASPGAPAWARPARGRGSMPWLPFPLPLAALLLGAILLAVVTHLWPLLFVFGVLWCTGVLRPRGFAHSHRTWSHRTRPHRRW